jgi:hypothetical protein
MQQGSNLSIHYPDPWAGSVAHIEEEVFLLVLQKK